MTHVYGNTTAGKRRSLSATIHIHALPGHPRKHDDPRNFFSFLSSLILYRYGTTQHTSSLKGRESLRSRDETWKRRPENSNGAVTRDKKKKKRGYKTYTPDDAGKEAIRRIRRITQAHITVGKERSSCLFTDG
jgi:hypothetical protein